MNGSNKRKYGREDVLTGCLCCLGANQYMSSRETMGTEILPEERNKSSLFLGPTHPQKAAIVLLWSLSFVFAAKGEKRERHTPVSLTECLDPERNEMEGKITSYNQFQNSFSFFIEAWFYYPVCAIGGRIDRHASSWQWEKMLQGML